jgi:hypothetical protein
VNYFKTKADAKAWADSYGYSYTYTIKPRSDDGLFYVVWGYREPDYV